MRDPKSLVHFDVQLKLRCNVCNTPCECSMLYMTQVCFCCLPELDTLLQALKAKKAAPITGADVGQ